MRVIVIKIDSCCSLVQQQLPFLCQCRILQLCEPLDIRSARLVCRALRDASTRVRWKVRRVYNKRQYAAAAAAAALGNLHTLDISSCNFVTDVSALAGIHTLNMSWCTDVANVSSLAGIRILYMSRCNAVRDVSALAGIRELDMRGCTAVQDVSALAGIRTLYIDHDQLNTRGLDALRKDGTKIIVI